MLTFRSITNDKSGKIVPDAYGYLAGKRLTIKIKVQSKNFILYIFFVLSADLVLLYSSQFVFYKLYFVIYFFGLNQTQILFNGQVKYCR